MTVMEKIAQSKTFLGIELGSTRIKAVLIDDTFEPIAAGSHDWENRYENGYWTYSLEDIHDGIRHCYAELKRDVSEKYGITLSSIGAMGVSAMMHGYMAFDENDRLLVPFRTWRNTTTEKAAEELTELLGFNIPQRWSIAHLYQAALNGEEHLPELRRITTLAGYIHFMLTGRRAVGVGEASGMFPLNSSNYDKRMAELVNKKLTEKGFERDILSLLPEIMTAGQQGAYLTEKGAEFLDPDGDLKAGIPLCPPEGDAGTGMTAANAVRPATGNISAGTSVFAMPILEKPLEGVYPEIDIVATPDGAVCAMVHCNNCCAELDSWVRIFGEFAELMGIKTDKSALYEALYTNAMTGDPDCGGVTAYNCLSGEPVIKVSDGRPMYFRTAESKMSLANFMRAQLYSAAAALKTGMDILIEKENVKTERMTAHGGLFKVRGTAQQVFADALNTAVSVMETAGEGGAWGMALLAAYMVCGGEKNLADWLDEDVFPNMERTDAIPDEEGARGFESYMEKFRAGLKAENALGEVK